MCKVLILLGSQADLPLTERGQEILRDFKIPFELRIASAHRSVRFLEELVSSFESKDGKVIICLAEMSAHLAGIVASMTNLPVLAIPVPGAATAGLDALLSVSQMPDEIPVAGMPLGKAGFTNAALFALQVLATADKELYRELQHYRLALNVQVLEADRQHQVVFHA
jgi:5-(carboxyamino)imidazole ribonucleotide mutase